MTRGEQTARSSWGGVALLCFAALTLLATGWKLYVYWSYDNLGMGILTTLGSWLGGLSIAVGIGLWPKLPKKSVRQAPGTFLCRIGRFFWPTKSYDRVFEPIISDLRIEYAEALVRHEIWHARWIWVRGHIQFWSAACGHLFVLIARGLARIWTAAN